MIEFDPTTKESRQNENWNRFEQIPKGKIYFQYLLFLYLIYSFILVTDQSNELIKLFSDWLNLAFELHQFE